MRTQPMAFVPDAPGSDAGLARSWRWSQHWRDVLFTHWSVPENKLLPLLPAGLELDTFDGTAWVSAVAFRLQRLRHVWLPTCRPVANFLELNLRTYVRRRGESGILFLSMHADSRLAVTLALCLTPLPYRFAHIEYEDAAAARFEVSRREGKNVRSLFRAEFTPDVSGTELTADAIDTWLLERYLAFVPGKRRGLYRMAVQHPRWQAQRTTATVAARGLGEEWGLGLERTPDLCHFSPGVAAADFAV